ncbi:MAG: hypothetical protein LBD96_03820 [Treponema sp.]|nr:hypothetical protein [Treponema sp.]
MISMIGELSSANGAPGFEDEVVALLRSYCQGLGDMYEDSLRNLFVYPKGNWGNRPVIQLDAHSDEAAFIVQNICADGTLKFHPRGGLGPLLCSCPRGKGADSGSLHSRCRGKQAPHYLSEAEKNSMPRIAGLLMNTGAG